MHKKGSGTGMIRCSFCNKPESQVARLLSGPNGVYICDQCIDLCATILDEESEEEKSFQKRWISICLSLKK